MNSLCCLIKPQWVCSMCNWTICRSHWKDAARKHHASESPDCPLVQQELTHILEDDLYTLIAI